MEITTHLEESIRSPIQGPSYDIDPKNAVPAGPLEIGDYSALPPYWKSVQALSGILTDPTFLQYLGNERIKSIQLPEAQSREYQVIITTEEGRVITVHVMDERLRTQLAYEGQKICDEEMLTPSSEIMQLLNLLNEKVCGYQIQQILREDGGWKISTLYDR